MLFLSGGGATSRSLSLLRVFESVWEGGSPGETPCFVCAHLLDPAVWRSASPATAATAETLRLVCERRGGAGAAAAAGGTAAAVRARHFP